MKIVFIFLLIINGMYAQTNWTIGIQHGNVVYQKLNPFMETFLKEKNIDQFSFNRLYYFNRNIALNSKSALSIGLSFEKRKMRILEISDSVYKCCSTLGPGGVITSFAPIVAIKTDLVLINYRQGINLSYKYILLNKEKAQVQVGGVLHNYITNISFYKITRHRRNKEFSYQSTDGDYSTPEIPLFANPRPSYNGTLEIFGNLLFKLTEKRHLGIRLSLGTSLKSNWDNFAKYLWLGTGIEYGFGKKKEKVKKV